MQGEDGHGGVEPADGRAEGVVVEGGHLGRVHGPVREEGVPLQQHPVGLVQVSGAGEGGQDVRGPGEIGGAFRSPLWREVVAAVLARPAVFTSAAEGTALGAAALALHALGRAPDLAEAPALLDPSHAQGTPVPTDPAVLEAYRKHREKLRGVRHRARSVQP